MGFAILMDMLRDWGHNERKHRAREVGRCDSVCGAQRHQRQGFRVGRILVAELWGMRGTGEASAGLLLGAELNFLVVDPIMDLAGAPSGCLRAFSLPEGNMLNPSHQSPRRLVICHT